MSAMGGKLPLAASLFDCALGFALPPDFKLSAVIALHHHP
jgi:hypothetical protein